MANFIVLLGPPGAGKGTQAEVLSKELDLIHISTGDIFRENLRNETKLGLMAKAYMTEGELVPDDVTNAMVRDRLSRDDCKNGGALLDGYPRTPDQAASLNETMKVVEGSLVCVPYIAVPADVLIERLSGRWTCPVCSTPYHLVSKPPRVVGKCDNDGADIIQREDDKPETVKNRINVYMNNTAPLIEYYQQQNLLIEVDGTQGIQEVAEDILKAVQERM
ncbi:MAG: adenylate kinase [Anaerolineaceae bacterium]|nr:adenylate kinase [Anaerolineaceae bacterium]